MDSHEDLQLIVAEQIKPVELFTKTAVLATFLDEIKQKVMSIVPDISTAKGRKDVASIAYKVAQTKTLLDKLGKDEVALLKDLPKQIDAGRKVAREFLEELQAEYRKPLTDYEEQERARLEAEETAREIEANHAEALEMEALLARERDVARKEAEFAKIEAERQAAEAARLQEEEAERLAKEQAEREERLKAEAAEKARIEAEEKAARLIAEAKEREEQAERDRLAAVERADNERKAAEEARIAAEAKAKADQEQAVKDAEERAAAETARKQAEKDAAEEAEKVRQCEAAADLNHRKQVDMMAISALMSRANLTISGAELVVEQIAAGNIPGITVNY